MSPRALQISPEVRLPQAAGGKAHGLQLIARAGLPSPPAWVVPPGATEADIDAFGDKLLSGGRIGFAVRSSAEDEDCCDTSFAGIHESHLGVRVEDLSKRVTEVAASAVSTRAHSYRRELGLPPPSGPCSVVVQEMVAADHSGVAFGVGEDNEAVLIEAVEGLGDTVVEGSVTPETHLVRRSGGEWRTTRRTPRSQSVVTTASGDGVARVTLNETRHGDVLDDRCAAAIADGVTRLQRLAGRRLDVEWTCSGNTVWFVQARPQTRPLTEELPAGQVWTRINVREVLPDIPSAFSRSTLTPLLDAAEREFLRMHGLRIDPAEPLFTHVLGRPVFSELMYLPSDLLGMSRNAAQAELGGSGEVDNAFHDVSPVAALRRPILLLRTVAVALKGERRATRVIARLRESRSAVEALSCRSAPDHQLLKVIAGGLNDLHCEMAVCAMSVVAAVATAQYPLLRSLRRHPAPRALVARLVAEGEVSVSTRQIEDLVDLAASMRQWPGCRGFVERPPLDHASATIWQRELPVELWRRVLEWIGRYGHRGPYESDLSSPRYGEDLSLLGHALFPLVTDEHLETAVESRRRRGREAERAWDEVAEICGPRGLKKARRAVRVLKRRMALRERLRSEAIALSLPVRRIGLELGRRLTDQGRLKSPEEIWHLTIDEIERAFSEPELDLEIAVRREQSRLAAWRRIDVPNRFTTEEIDSLAYSAKPAEASSMLYGNGISPGVVEGEVRVLMTPGDAYRFMAGAVLVAPATDPAWTPLFARAVGIVVEIGGALSHAGIVAREYGIPCVANIDLVTRELRDGDVVRIDGSLGLVTVVSRAGSAPDACAMSSQGSPC